MREITLGSLFDGIGGFPYAASFYGIRSLWASEIELSCVSVTQKFFPDMAHVGDVTRLDGYGAQDTECGVRKVTERRRCHTP